MAKRTSIPRKDDVVGSVAYPAKESSAANTMGKINEDGTIGIGVSKQKPKNIVQKADPAPTVEKVAIFSTKNVSWPGVGNVVKGYNIVKKDVAEKWLTRNHVRSATPEEIAKEYGL